MLSPHSYFNIIPQSLHRTSHFEAFLLITCTSCSLHLFNLHLLPLLATTHLLSLYLWVYFHSVLFFRFYTSEDHGICFSVWLILLSKMPSRIYLPMGSHTKKIKLCLSLNYKLYLNKISQIRKKNTDAMQRWSWAIKNMNSPQMLQLSP